MGLRYTHTDYFNGLCWSQWQWPEKVVLEYFCVAHGRLHGSGIQAKNFKYAEVNHMKVEWHKMCSSRGGISCQSESLKDCIRNYLEPGVTKAEGARGKSGRVLGAKARQVTKGLAGPCRAAQTTPRRVDLMLRIMGAPEMFSAETARWTF